MGHRRRCGKDPVVTRLDAATQRQIEAARPDQSTWLSANAGSGKTRVLTDRVARLLLNDEDPQNILCLTYTKAAASEMQNRLFKRLGQWAMLPDKDLSKALRVLGVDQAVTAKHLRDARRLFARAIETPGGLKIQTIHSFCASLLRRFPLEAGVTPQFQEMDERSARLLRSEVTEVIAKGENSTSLDAVARHYTGDSFEGLTAEIVKHKALFMRDLDAAALYGLFDLAPDASVEALEQEVFLGGETALLHRLREALQTSGPNDQKAAAKLVGITQPGIVDLPVLESVFLTGPHAKSPFSAKTGTFPTKTCQSALADIMPDIDAWMLRVEAARETRLALDTIAKTRFLHEFASIFLQAYETAKSNRGWLDFDDLILKARDLLVHPDVATWVLYRLDGQLDHILVDEAQDTSPVQWQVIELLAQEFTSGKGARTDKARTIFVVGDKKQSIYSFQGADPEEFDRMQSDFADRLKDTDAPLKRLGMEFSFRSSQAILSLVDRTFENAHSAGFSPEQSHKAFKTTLPGRVDLWPYIEPSEQDDLPAWHMPVDIKAANDPSVMLASQIASTIKKLISDRHPIPNSEAEDGKHSSRPIQAGDFLILVQRRGDLFHDIIRECKAQGLPVAGADRMKIGAEIAVRDLAALLSFLATPEDNYSLAVALKSPLFGWTEKELFTLAHGRHSPHLWRELENRRDETPETHAILRDLRDKADYLRPYDLMERILTRHDGRRRLLARLGTEAEEGIDALLSQAMAYEQQSVDSLTGFLVWLQSDEVEIKRQMDSAGDRIRVMTVHGAKGLEAPVVILPDTGVRRSVIRDQIIETDNVAIWRSPADATPRKTRDALAQMKADQEAERDRLLYVAMTRAEKWLIVAAAGQKGDKGDTWYEKIEAGMKASGAHAHDFGGCSGLRLEYENWGEIETESASTVPSDRGELPAYFRAPVSAKPEASKTLSPSDLGGAKALPDEQGQDEDAAKRRGRQIHKLLEFLPDVGQPLWPETAMSLLAHGEDAATQDEFDLLFSEATNVLIEPSLEFLFSQDALAEVPISAPLDSLGGQRVHGTIDRLLVTPETVLAVDFKTNASVPISEHDVPDGLLRQMGAYAHALQTVYPSHKISTAILWTRTATLMYLPHDLVTDALRNTQMS